MFKFNYIRVIIMRLEGIYSLVESKGILKEINFDFNEGKLYYVVVENEKTGVNMFDIIGLVSPIMRGKYIINGVDVSGFSYRAKTEIRKEYIGFLFKEILLDNDFNVFDNVLIPLINNKKLEKNKKEEKVINYLKKYNLDNLMEKYPKNLSAYERQMVSLVRALINDPHFILAYEPTDLLSENEEKEFYEVLKKITKLNIGVIIITRKVLYKEYADEIYWYENKLM